jgi:hypothetical protein
VTKTLSVALTYIALSFEGAYSCPKQLESICLVELVIHLADFLERMLDQFGVFCNLRVEVLDFPSTEIRFRAV